MNFEKRIQINVMIQQEPILAPNIKDGSFIPLAWKEEVHNTNAPYSNLLQLGSITSSEADEFKGRIYADKSLAIASKAIGWSLGTLLFIGVIALSIQTHRLRIEEKNKGYKPLTLAAQTKYGATAERKTETH